MENAYCRAASLLPGAWRRAALSLPEAERRSAEEFRLRAGRRMSVLLPEGERTLPLAPEVTEETLRDLLEIVTEASAHAAAEQLRRGCVTARGGCRVGFCGQAVSENGRLRTLRGLRSAAVRVPHTARGCADGLFPALGGAAAFRSTLLLSPPGGGKTTLARELVRLLSTAGVRVAVADERGELALSETALGPTADVLSLAPKAEAAMLLLRGMNPQVIAMDEITSPEDLEAVELAAGCGVALLATAHAAEISELQKRPLYRRLLALEAFSQAVVIRKTPEGGRRYQTEALL